MQNENDITDTRFILIIKEIRDEPKGSHYSICPQTMENGIKVIPIQAR